MQMQKVFFWQMYLREVRGQIKVLGRNFYNKKVVPSEETFQNAMLKVYESKFLKHKKAKAALYFKFCE